MKYLKKRLHKLLLSSFLLMMTISPAMANRCSTQMFTVTLNSSLTYSDVLENLADECGLTLLVKDLEAKMKLQENIYFVKLNNASLEELLDTVLKENNIGYELIGNKLRISYLQTKTFNLHYIAGTRIGKSNAHVTIANNNGSDDGSSGSSGSGVLTGSSGSKTGVSIESSDDFQFWSKIQEELYSLINRPEDSYKAPKPIVNPEAGMITVTGTAQQLERIKKYVDEITAQLKNQVLIDVKILSVTFDDSATTGVDWSQLYSLQNMAISTFQMAQNNIAGLTWSGGGGNAQIGGTPEEGAGPSSANALVVESSTNVSDLIRFLKTQGDVKSISNPKIMTLNNQPALISVGNELFYKIQSSAILQNNTGSGLVSQGETIDSVFAGILLDITPEISDDGTITLKINPSISDTIDTVERDNGGSRNIPPDLSRKQISSVVTVRDGQHVILGGLISSKSGKQISKVPLLGDLPLLDQLFKREVKIENVEELVLILTPRIIKHSTDISLEDLGYRKLKDEKQVQ